MTKDKISMNMMMKEIVMIWIELKMMRSRMKEKAGQQELNLKLESILAK